MVRRVAARLLPFVFLFSLPVNIGACALEPMTPPTAIFSTDTCRLPESFFDEGVDREMMVGARALPVDIRARLNAYLLNRVGVQVARNLRIREVWYPKGTPVKNHTTPHRDEPSGVAYAVFVGLPVADDMSTCGNYVDREYCAGIWLNESGRPLTEIGLPAIARDPAKAHLLTRAEAVAAVKSTGLVPIGSTLEYLAEADILVWHIEGQIMRNSGENEYVAYLVNAHTGAVLGWHSLSHPYAH